MDLKLHRGGRFRRWLGVRLGGDFALGDRIWRRVLHGLGAAALVYYAIPSGFFVIAPKVWVLVAALVAVLFLELLRHLAGLELPTIRAYEERRVGSFALFGIAIVAAIVLFPEPIAAAVILGGALVDPLAGEIRGSRAHRGLSPWVPLAVYGGLAFTGLSILGGWPVLPSFGLAAGAAFLAIAVEGPRIRWMDDDLAMMFVPAVALYLVAVVGLRLGP